MRLGLQEAKSRVRREREGKATSAVGWEVAIPPGSTALLCRESWIVEKEKRDPEGMRAHRKDKKHGGDKREDS